MLEDDEFGVDYEKQLMALEDALDRSNDQLREVLSELKMIREELETLRETSKSSWHKQWPVPLLALMFLSSQIYLNWHSLRWWPLN